MAKLIISEQRNAGRTISASMVHEYAAWSLCQTTRNGRWTEHQAKTLMHKVADVIDRSAWLLATGAQLRAEQGTVNNYVLPFVTLDLDNLPSQVELRTALVEAGVAKMPAHHMADCILALADIVEAVLDGAPVEILDPKNAVRATELPAEIVTRIRPFEGGEL